MVTEILLLIAAYLRKANHPTETDQDIQAGVIADLLKIRSARRAVDLDVLEAPPDLVDLLKKAKGLA